MMKVNGLIYLIVVKSMGLRKCDVIEYEFMIEYEFIWIEVV